MLGYEIESITNYEPLFCLFKKTYPHGILAIWALLVQELSIKCSRKLGVFNEVSDALFMSLVGFSKNIMKLKKSEVCV